MYADVFSARRPINGGEFYSLPALADAGIADVSRLPVSLRIVLESVVRNCRENPDSPTRPEHAKKLANWRPDEKRESEIPFSVARVVLQDFTGVPLLADLAAMRDAAAKAGKNPKSIEPVAPVDLVVDHSVQVDFAGRADAAKLNMEIEFERNRERYQFLKWGARAFGGLRVVPPGIGIVHQVNLEHLARGVFSRDGVLYPDSLVGADSHTTMINGAGVVGWGVGGIEAEAAMLGQPVFILTPDVVGMRIEGRLRPGVTATDLVLTVTEILRNAKVVGQFVEFFGDGAAALEVPDRATIANMAPEYGATMGFFAVDDKTLDYLRATGRDEKTIQTLADYLRAQQLFGIPRVGQCDYSRVIELDLDRVEPSVAGPKRPQDRIALSSLKGAFADLFTRPIDQGGFGKKADDLKSRRPTDDPKIDVGDGDVLIAAITSCTNTSNPGVLLAAGLLAQKASARGLRPHPRVKTSFAPGSRVVHDYLQESGLLAPLEQLGFQIVGYGCTTCIGNSGPLAAPIEKAVADGGLVGASVLSGNRNFEARVHPAIRANFLMSPPLVVAFALAGRVNFDFESEPLGIGDDGKPVFLRDIWPSPQEIAQAKAAATNPENYRRRYGADFDSELPLWRDIESGGETRYEWRDDSTYIRKPPFFAADRGFTPVRGARALAIFGDSITTDHISPAGSIAPSSPAGRYLQAAGIKIRDFNSYGARRGNHEVMMRGAFANVRVKNKMAGGREGGFTVHHPDGETLPIFDAAMRYAEESIPLVVFAGDSYGAGSSRDWAAKGPRLLGVRAVVAKSFERIHRSNLVGMGVLPCQFAAGDSAESLGIEGDETFSIEGIESAAIPPRSQATLVIRKNGSEKRAPITALIETPAEVEYFKQGGILPFVLGRIAA